MKQSWADVVAACIRSRHISCSVYIDGPGLLGDAQLCLSLVIKQCSIQDNTLERLAEAPSSASYSTSDAPTVRTWDSAEFC